MAEDREAVSGEFRLAPASPLLNDIRWQRGFKQAVQNYLREARELSRCLSLLGYPVGLQILRIATAFGELRDHLQKVMEDYLKLTQEAVLITYHNTTIFECYQCACSLVDQSPFLSADSSPAELNRMLCEPSSCVPSPAELETFLAILDHLSPLDSPARMVTLGDPDHSTPECDATPHPAPAVVKPQWDRARRILSVQRVVCRKFTREADNQFRILDAFEASGWPSSLPNPLKSLEHLNQAIKDFNRKVKPGGPFRLRRDNMKVAWTLNLPPTSPPKIPDLHP